MKPRAASSAKYAKSQTLQESHSWRHLCVLSCTPDDRSQQDPGCDRCEYPHLWVLRRWCWALLAAHAVITFPQGGSFSCTLSCWSQRLRKETI